MHASSFISNGFFWDGKKESAQNVYTPKKIHIDRKLSVNRGSWKGKIDKTDNLAKLGLTTSSPPPKILLVTV